jgi:hypothetical protein
MKYFIRLTYLVIIIAAGITHSCKEDEVPVLTTSVVTNISVTTATGGGTITRGDPEMITLQGICWSKGNNPTIEGFRTLVPAGPLTFTSDMSELDPSTTYFVRAYAINYAGIGYGEAVSFTTLN